MFKNADDMVRELKEQMRGGKGTVEIQHVFKQEELTGKCRLMARVTMNPGCSIGIHEHVNEEEVYYILKGKGLVVDQGVTREIGAGDAVLTGGGASHSIENIGDEPLEMMAIVLLY